ncbi:polymorphic toxin-type HINT domain-containing protein [Streptomyces aurantiogriseus]
METVSEAVDWGQVWEGVKTVGNVVGEVTGFNDIKNCVTKGDMEACAWAAATVGGVLLGGAGATAVRAAKAGRMAAKAAKYADDIAKAAEKTEDTVDKIETAVECTSTAMDVASMASANSFVPGTEVVMADGSRKPIEQVKEGDEVLATDPTTGKTSKQKVTDTIEGKGEKKLVKLTVHTDGDQGHATDTITATAGHPFWVPDLKKWLKAGELKPGQWLQTGSGTWVQIDAVSAWTQQAAVYNLTVDTAHTYHVVAGAEAVLVHNIDIKPVGEVGQACVAAGQQDIEGPSYARKKYKRPTAGVRTAAINKSPTCPYCGQNNSTDYEHVSPQKEDWDKGGWLNSRDARSTRVNRSTNTTGACKSCNSSKQDKPIGTGPGEWWPPGWPAGTYWPYGGNP